MPNKQNTGHSLRDNRIIYVNGSFCEDQVKTIVENLFLFEMEDYRKDVTMFIDSYGGSIHSLLAIYDAMKLVRCDIATVTIGKAMSCGQMLLMCGTKGKRFATKHARILMHEMSGGSVGKLSEVEAHTEEMNRLNELLIDIIVENSKLKPKEVRNFLKNEVYMSPEDALKYGLIDHIVETHKDLYSKINV